MKTLQDRNCTNCKFSQILTKEGATFYDCVLKPPIPGDLGATRVTLPEELAIGHNCVNWVHKDLAFCVDCKFYQNFTCRHSSNVKIENCFVQLKEVADSTKACDCFESKPYGKNISL